MAELDRGNGSDGNVTFSANKNLNTDIVAGGRSYADMVVYSCSTVNSDNVITTATPNGIVAGDKVILINIQGDESSYTNVGNYEIFVVDSVNSNTITFTTSKTKYYGSGASNDLNIGTGETNQRVIIQRIPQYNDATINASVTLTGNSYGGASGGLFSIYVKGTLTINNNGGIDMSEKGYRYSTVYNGGTGSGPLKIGFDPGSGNPYSVTNPPGGAAGCDSWNGGGGGGGYATAGDNGGPASGHYFLGGSSYGSANLTDLFFGASGGGGWEDHKGGRGGGIILIHATTITLVGSGSFISSNGADGTDYPGSSAAGGGAGGSILLHCGSVTASSNNIEALKGNKGVGFENPPSDVRSGGDGSVGRIAIYHPSDFSLTGNECSPTPYSSNTLTIGITIGTRFGSKSDGTYLFGQKDEDTFKFGVE